MFPHTCAINFASVGTVLGYKYSSTGVSKGSPRVRSSQGGVSWLYFGYLEYLEYLGPILAILDIIVGTIAKPLAKTVRY